MGHACACVPRGCASAWRAVGMHRAHKCGVGIGARAAAGSPDLGMRELLDHVCDIAVAVPSLGRVLARSVLPRAALLAWVAGRCGAPGAPRKRGQPRKQPILGKVLGAFAEAMPEVRALEALQ